VSENPKDKEAARSDSWSRFEQVDATIKSGAKHKEVSEKPSPKPTADEPEPSAQSTGERQKE
jgi:hypothetical protein